MLPLAIGTIIPSSNRIVERATAAVLRHLPGIDSCIARIPFHGAGLGQPKDGYDAEPYRQAAWQLGHADVGVVCWNGTRGAALGLEKDRALCDVMAVAAGCPATTTSLAALAVLERLGARRLGIVTPNEPAGAAAAAAGFGRELVAVRALGLTDNLASALVPPARLAALARELAAEARPDAILIWSTNLAGWEAMAPVEAEFGIPVLDGAAVGVRGALAAIGADLSAAAPLGRIFTLPA
jgi:maleate isomerase